jgi:3-mercaptopyruvate sulfurtransferase SseA
MDKYGGADGNLYSLDRYLDKIDENDRNLEYITDSVKSDVEKIVSDFEKVMNDFHEQKQYIAEMLDERGLNNDDSEVMQIMYDSADEDILEQINSIDW